MMTEPRKCPEPGCGLEMEEQFTRCVDVDGNAEVAWVCPATPEQHEIAALRARVAELESKLSKPKRCKRDSRACLLGNLLRV